VESGDVDGAWAGCAHVVEGEVRLGGQEHFYLEPQGTLILPGENDEYTVISSTQARLPPLLRMTLLPLCANLSATALRQRLRSAVEQRLPRTPG
jgi:hypothetical protein